MTTEPGRARRDRCVLGIVDGLHDAGAALVRDGRLVAAANEERFTREKLQGGMPVQSIAAVLRTAGVGAHEVDVVAVGGLATPTVATRLFRPLQRVYARSLGICFDRPWHPADRLADLVRYRLPLTRSHSGRGGRVEAALAAPVLRRGLPMGLRDSEVQFVDHHLSHAESAWRTAGDGDWLVITADAHGDGRSLGVWEARAGMRSPVLKQEIGVRQSLGAFYSYVTRALGFRPGRHEGKVLGLSARGDAQRVGRPFPFRWAGEALQFEGTWGLRGSRDVAPLGDLPREDVAAWVQGGTETILVSLAQRWLERTGHRQVALAGGVFANVRINGLLANLPQVDRLHVFPHMGDGGLAAGAALHVADALPRALESACLGPALAEGDVLAQVDRRGFPHARPAAPDEALVDVLASGRPVVRCVGRMEFGPRALGHRSVLAPADDAQVTNRLSQALDRDDFMPFAPLLREEDAEQAFPGLAVARHACRFMTVALPCTDAFRQAYPAAVHVDGTARPQVVSRQAEPDLHALLTAYSRTTGKAALINTSFNMHEEPIVAGPEDALRAFARSGLPLMRLGPLVVEQRIGRSPARERAASE